MDNSFFTRDLHDWLSVNGKVSKLTFTSQPPWMIIFTFTIWNIWLKRNQLVFHNRPIVTNYALEIMGWALEFFHCVLSPKMRTSLMIKRVSWEKPGSGWMKLNMDGSTSCLGIAGGGGLVRDENGSWVFGFAKKIGKASSFIAELWALHDGLRLCLSRNILVVEVELDAKSIVELLTKQHHPNSSNSTLMDDCRQLITLFH